MSTFLAELSGPLYELWLPLAMLSGVAMGALLAGGFIGRRHGRLAVTEPRALAAMTVTPRPLPAGQVDLDAELRAAAASHEGSARRLNIRLEVAVQPDLTVRADPAALRQIVSSLLENAINHSAGGGVLLSAGRHGGRVRIAVLDDGAPVDRSEQEANLRDAERLAAMQGGTLEIIVSPGSGTTVAVRLPEPGGAGTARTAHTASQEPQTAAPAAPTRAAAAVRAE